MANISKLAKYQSSAVCLAGVSAAVWIIVYGKISHSRRQKKRNGPEEQIQYMISEKRDKRIQRAQVNSLFFKQLRELLAIIIPGFWSKECALLFLIAGSLVARSMSDVWLIQTITMIEGAVVTMDKTRFRSNILRYFSALPLIAVINNVLKWGLGELKLRFRTNLSHHLYNQYLKGFTYYKMSNLDNRISNADQLLTTDIDKFCESVTDVYSNVSKPILDIVLYVYRLTMTLGGKSPSILMLYLLVSGVFLTHLRKPTGALPETNY